MRQPGGHEQLAIRTERKRLRSHAGKSDEFSGGCDELIDGRDELIRATAANRFRRDGEIFRRLRLHDAGEGQKKAKLGQ